MYTPIYDVAKVLLLIEAKLCWFKFEAGGLELADTWFEQRVLACPTESHNMFHDMVRDGKYGIMTEE